MTPSGVRAPAATPPLGAVPTPPALASRLVGGVPPGAAALDPACGDGVLLAALLEADLAAGRDPLEALGRLHGIELDPARAAAARARLERLATGLPHLRAPAASSSPGHPGTCGPDTPARPLHAAEADPSPAGRPPSGAATGGRAHASRAVRVECRDALSCPWPAATWVVANPPWGALSGRPSRRLSAADRRRLARAGPGGWPSLQGPFLERIARHVAEHGTGARLVLPAALLESPR